MKKYLDLLRFVRDNGTRQANRTGIDAISVPGAMLQFDLAEGFPLLTTKKMAFKALKGELIAFLRAAENAADFRALGCNFWDQNANENEPWLKNPFRKGHDDLGRIYGAQWRRRTGDLDYRNDQDVPEAQRSPFRLNTPEGQLGVYAEPFDQVMAALNTIHNDPTSRRIIIDAWVPSEFRQMALPPCHVLYQFIVNVERKEINLCMYQRSADMFLGVPMNIGSCALLLSIFGHLTGYKPRHFTHFLADAHIYVNHLDQVEEQLQREPKELPSVRFSDRIKPYDGKFFNPWQIDSIGPEDIILEGYDDPHPAIKAPMAV
jgi:thymidylate synthase